MDEEEERDSVDMDALSCPRMRYSFEGEEERPPQPPHTGLAGPLDARTAPAASRLLAPVADARKKEATRQTARPAAPANDHVVQEAGWPWVELFVPGRVCLLGEHSDWAGGFRRVDPHGSLEPGFCLVTGTEEGLFARARRTAPSPPSSSSSSPSCPAAARATPDEEGDEVAEEEKGVVSPRPVGPGGAMPLPQQHRAQGAAAGAGAAKAGAGRLDLRCLDAAGKERMASLDLGDPEGLRRLAAAGGFFCYAAGVAYVVATTHDLQGGGLEFVNDATTLPLCKGLSSSAAFCVALARAFNQTYGLRYTARGEMEVAYRGETVTPSKCGRMDQCCAFGQQAVFMTFDGDFLHCEPLALPPGCRLHYVIVDLCASKNTTEILRCLSRAYPTPTGGGSGGGSGGGKDEAAAYAKELAIQTNVVNFLGPTNRRLLSAAKAAFLAGNAERIGAIMGEYQSLFDANLGPACPAQLAAPELHRCLAHPPLQPHLYGGKGIGSQGDGSAQLLCRSAASQEAVMTLVRDDLKMVPLKLTLSG